MLQSVLWQQNFKPIFCSESYFCLLFHVLCHKRHPQVLAVQREALVTCWMLSVLLEPLAGGIWLLGVGCCGLGMLSG